MTPLRIGVIGAGAWGRNHVRTVAGLPDAELAAVCDLSPAVRERMARAYPGAYITEAVPALLERCDAVVIASTAGTHASLGLAAIRAGKPALVEKPFALNVREATELATEADRLGAGVHTLTTSRTNSRGLGNVVNGVLDPDFGLMQNAVGTYTAGDLTPSVLGIRVMVVANSGATSITAFDDGVTGQVVSLVFSDVNTTITLDNCYLAGAAAFVSGVNDTLTLVNVGANKWSEVARSGN